MPRPGEPFDSGATRVRVRAGGFSLSIGGAAPIILDRRCAQDVVHALTYALLATAPQDQPRRAPPPARPARRPAG